MFNIHANALIDAQRRQPRPPRHEARLPVSWPLPAPQEPTRRPPRRRFRIWRRDG